MNDENFRSFLSKSFPVLHLKRGKKKKQSTSTTINEVCDLILDITERLNEAEKWISGEGEIKVWKRSIPVWGLRNKQL